MDAANVLALHDQWSRRAHIRRQRNLAMQSPRRAARQVAARRRLWAYRVGRCDEFARLRAARVRENAFRKIRMAKICAAPRMGYLCRSHIPESKMGELDLDTRE